MDVVYVVRPGDENEELRYSLRSLANVPHDRVWVVGHKPPWVTGVGYVPTVPRRKFRSAPTNLLTACVMAEISDPFWLFNDDFFVMRPVDQLPVLHRGPLADLIAARRRDDVYQRGMRRAAALLDGWGVPDPLSYDLLHVPLPVRKAAFLDAWERAHFTDFRLPTFARTLYGNLAGLGGDQAADGKVYDRASVPPDDALIVSTSDDSFKGAVGQWLRDRFPEPGPYEE